MFYARTFCRNICIFKQKIYNFRSNFTDYFAATVKFEKNYNLFNLKFSCMKKKLIFAGAVVLMAAAAVTAYMSNYRPDPFDLLNANIEALAQDESLDPGESSTSKWLTMSRYCSGGSMEWACSCKPVSPTRCLNAPCYVDC